MNFVVVVVVRHRYLHIEFGWIPKEDASEVDRPFQTSFCFFAFGREIVYGRLEFQHFHDGPGGVSGACDSF